MTGKTETESFHTTVDITVDDARWSGALPELEKLTQDAIEAVLNRTEQSGTEISVSFVSDEAIRILNRKYRKKDKATNVLSFPQQEQNLLGDVVLAFEIIEREAQEQEKSFADHVRHLIVHGTLHLLGHDHEEETQAAEMERLEIAILAELGVKNPYESGYFVP